MINSVYWIPDGICPSFDRKTQSVQSEVNLRHTTCDRVFLIWAPGTWSIIHLSNNIEETLTVPAGIVSYFKAWNIARVQKSHFLKNSPSSYILMRRQRRYLPEFSSTQHETLLHFRYLLFNSFSFFKWKGRRSLDPAEPCFGFKIPPLFFWGFKFGKYKQPL